MNLIKIIQKLINGNFEGARACSYPGTAISGRMSSVKFYSCDNGLEIKGPKMLKCLKDGKWSSTLPMCVNPDIPAAS
jgi:hypothetical protein